MANLTPDVAREVDVGAANRIISCALLQPYRVTARVLTGYAARIQFWYPDSAPHVIRAALVDEANGFVIYRTRGDEFTAYGECLAQFTIMAPDWYGGNAPARWYARTSTPILRFHVLERPA